MTSASFPNPQVTELPRCGRAVVANGPQAKRRRQEVRAFAQQLGLDAIELEDAAYAVWSNLNPQSCKFERALSLAGVALQAAQATR